MHSVERVQRTSHIHTGARVSNPLRGALEVPEAIQASPEVNTPLRELFQCPKLLKQDLNQTCSEGALGMPNTLQTEDTLEVPKTFRTRAQASTALGALLKY